LFEVPRLLRSRARGALHGVERYRLTGCVRCGKNDNSGKLSERRKEVHKFNYREGVLLMATFAATASMMATLLDTARGLV